MNDREQTQASLDKQPEIEAGQSFRFACHPNVPCFNACCVNLNMALTPYDALRLRRGLGLGSEAFLKDHVRVSAHPENGYPMVHLRMTDGPTPLCPHAGPAGCAVYEDRPSACRLYPLDRVTQLDEEGTLSVHYFITHANHCHGHEEDAEQTIDSWLQSQDLPDYNAHNDRYMALMARGYGQPPLGTQHSTFLLLALYQPDRFADFIQNMRIFDRVDVSPQDQEAILAADEQGEERRLSFAYDLVELMLYGSTANLKPRVAP